MHTLCREVQDQEVGHKGDAGADTALYDEDPPAHSRQSMFLVAIASRCPLPPATDAFCALHLLESICK